MEARPRGAWGQPERASSHVTRPLAAASFGGAPQLPGQLDSMKASTSSHRPAPFHASQTALPGAALAAQL